MASLGTAFYSPHPVRGVEDLTFKRMLKPAALHSVPKPEIQFMWKCNGYAPSVNGPNRSAMSG